MKRFLYALLSVLICLSLLGGERADAAGAFDAKASALVEIFTNTSPITSANLTIGGSGSIVFGVFSSKNDVSGAVATGCTWNGVAMTAIGNVTVSSGKVSTYVYALVSPATGNHTLSCSFTAGSGGGPSAYLDAFSLSGTDTTSVAVAVPSGNVLTDVSTPAGTVYPTTAFSVTTASGDVAGAVAVWDGDDFFTAVSPAVHINGDFASLGYDSIYNLSTGATTSMQFGSGAGTHPGAGIAFRVIQPGAGGATCGKALLLHAGC